MRIQDIEVTNYKAFLGTYKLKVGGKNLFIYGENGSGKSSLYYALKDFFQASVETIDLSELENIFVTDGERGKTAISIGFKPDGKGQERKKTYTWNSAKHDGHASDDTSIPDANSLKSFLTYKHLLGIHHVRKGEAINLFDLLVKTVLKHFKYTLTGGKELGELWEAVETTVARRTGKEYPINKKRADVQAAIKTFNEAFGELFKKGSPEHILKHAGRMLAHFNHNIELDLHFPQVRPVNDYNDVEGAEVQVNLKFAGKIITQPQLFLNEARLSAIALSIYLGMIKRHVQGIPCKVLFLDDVFIGLDISNRLPLLGILEQEFPEYQIILTTYDKPWYEHARGFLDDKYWKTMEFYAQPVLDGTEIPRIDDNGDMLTKARDHLNQCDYKAAAVYARSAFEKLIRKHCEKEKKKLVFKSQLKNYTSQDFWQAIKDDLPQNTVRKIESYRALVLNAFSHYDTEKHQIKTELENTIQAVEELKAALS